MYAHFQAHITVKSDVCNSDTFRYKKRLRMMIAAIFAS